MDSANLMKPDVIVSQPDSVDFPLWRETMSKNREFFGKILVSICRTYSSLQMQRFFQEELAKIGAEVFLAQLPANGQDWRDLSVNQCLKHITSNRVLFLEQDFLFNDERFLPTALGCASPILGFKEVAARTGRFHPAFLLVDADLVKKTSRDFGVVPDKYDHFWTFSKELEELATPAYLQDLGLTQPEHWEHLAGLTSNYSLLLYGGKPNHNVKRFAEYNKKILECSSKQHVEFERIVRRAAAIEVA